MSETDAWLRSHGHPGWTVYTDAAPRPAAPKKGKLPLLMAAGALAVGVGLGALIGAAVPHPAPEECGQALGYAEQALGQSADGMGALGDAMGGGYSDRLRAIKELDGVTAEIKRLTPLYQDAKKVCLG